MKYIAFFFLILVFSCKKTIIGKDITIPDNSNLSEQRIRLKSVNVVFVRDTSIFIQWPQTLSKSISQRLLFKYSNGNLIQIVEENNDELFKTFLIDEINFLYNSNNQLISKKNIVVNNFNIPYSSLNSNLTWKDSILTGIDNYIINANKGVVKLTYPCSPTSDYNTSITFNANSQVKEIITEGGGCVPEFDYITTNKETILNYYKDENLVKQSREKITTYNSGRDVPKLGYWKEDSQEMIDYSDFTNPFSLLPNNAFPLKSWHYEYNNLESLRMSFSELSYLNGHWSSFQIILQKKYYLTKKQYSRKEYQVKSEGGAVRNYLHTFSVIEHKGNLPTKAEEKITYNGKSYGKLKYSFEYENN